MTILNQWQEIHTAPGKEVVLVAWDDPNIDWDFCTAAKWDGIWTRAGGDGERVEPQWWMRVERPE